MISLTTGMYALGTSVTAFCGWYYVGQPVRSKIKLFSEVSDIFEGKNIDKHGADAPQPMKELTKQLKSALERFDLDRAKSCQIVQEALACFLSHSNHENMVEQPLLRELIDLFTELQTSTSPDLKTRIERCHRLAHESIEKIQGRLTKIKEVFKGLFPQVKQAVLDHIRAVGQHSEESLLHPLHKIRNLQQRTQSDHRDRLIHFHLNRLGLEDVAPENLDNRIKTAVFAIQRDDPEGFDLICQKLKLETPTAIFFKPQATLDRFFVEYKQMRLEKPLLPNQSTLPVELQWKTSTNYETEKQKGFDLAAAFGALVVFKMRYGADTRTKTGFYRILSRAHSLSESERKKLVIDFLRDERERLGQAWLPWAVDQHIFESIYILLKEVSNSCVNSSPVSENIKAELKKTPIPAMVYLGEKTSCYFLYLINKYAEWIKDYPYDFAVDRFLKNKLYSRQEDSPGSLNLDFFLSRYNLVRNLQELSDNLYSWACRPCFYKSQSLSLVNPALVLIKHAMLLLPRLSLQLMKLPAIFVQWVLNIIFLALVEQILVHTTLFEKVDEVVTEALLDPSPYQYPLLEVLLKNLQEILEVIENKQPDRVPSHPDDFRAKQELKKTVETFGDFAKALNSLEDPKNKSSDQAFFKTLLPLGINKVVETILRVHAVYTEREDLEHRGTEFLQALNFYVYNKHKPTDVDEALIQRHKDVKEHIHLYLSKIAQALLVQISAEKISDEAVQWLKELLSTDQESNSLSLIQDYIQENKNLVIEVLKKSYIMKGLFMRIITQDRDA